MLMNPRKLCVAALLVMSLAPALSRGQDYYLFTSFRGNGEDGLHLALSTNGYHWAEVNQGRSLLKPALGGYNLMRDPCLAQGSDGAFHLVWTTGWTTEKGNTIGYARSKDLIEWSEQKGIPLMTGEPGTRNLWAPEIFYDRQESRWIIFWSSTVKGKFTETAESGDDGYNHRFYYATTRDFSSFSESKLFYDPGFNCIDATLLAAEGRYYLFFKDERKTPTKKNLRYAIAGRPTGPFAQLSEPFTGDWVEGPSAIRIKDEYLVYFDHYANPHYYGAVRSKDLRQWEDCSREMAFPSGHRHGSVLKISSQVARTLMAHGQ